MRRAPLTISCAYLLASAACSDAPAPTKDDTPAATPAFELPPVDAAGATKLAEALPQAPPEMRPTLAAVGLAELERGRLPGPFIEGLEAIGNAPPDMRSTLLARALAESLPMLNHLCGDGAKLMRSLAEMAPEQRGPAIYDGCSMQAHGLLSREDLPSSDAMMVLMGHLVHDHLTRAGPLHPGERAAVMAMVEAKASVPADERSAE